jgi:dephospho-CoA kinase
MIIGLGGRSGAGKGVIVEYLASKHGFKHFSFSAFLAEELRRRGVPITRPSLGDMGDEIRATKGSISKVFLESIKGEIGDIVLESVRSIAEANHIKSVGGVIWVVEADIKERYRRISERKSEIDNIPFEQFVREEENELANPEPHKMNMNAVAAMADVTLQNDGTKEELYGKIEKTLKEVQ